MTKKGIFRLARLLMILLFAAFPALRGEIQIYKNLQMRTERSGGADYLQLRQIARKIENLLRREKNKLPKGKTMVVFTNAPKFSLNSSSRPWLLHLPGNAKLWGSDFQLRRKLYGAIAAARTGVTPVNSAPQLSEWLTAAIDKSIDNAQTAELYLTGNPTSFCAAQFFRNGGKLPEFSGLCTITPALLAPESRMVYDEFSLLLAILLAKRQLLLRQIEEELRGGAADSWAKNFLGGSASRQSLLEKDAWQIVWNRRQPLPPEVIEERIAPLTEFAVPEIDANGKFTGKKHICSPAEASRLLANPQRNDAGALRRSFAAPWKLLASECDSASLVFCRKIVEPITLFGIDPHAPEEFSAALDAFKKHLAVRRKREELLNRTERENLPLPRLLNRQLETVNGGNPALTTPEKIFLELSERDYLAE